MFPKNNSNKKRISQNVIKKRKQKRINLFLNFELRVICQNKYENAYLI